MKAEDTVMKPEDYAKIIERYKAFPQSNFASGRSDLVEQLIKAQAKISFKAGYEWACDDTKSEQAQPNTT